MKKNQQAKNDESKRKKKETKKEYKHTKKKKISLRLKKGIF